MPPQQLAETTTLIMPGTKMNQPQALNGERKLALQLYLVVGTQPPLALPNGKIDQIAITGDRRMIKIRLPAMTETVMLNGTTLNYHGITYLQHLLRSLDNSSLRHHLQVYPRITLIMQQ
jgi:hypothetical protein